MKEERAVSRQLDLGRRYPQDEHGALPLFAFHTNTALVVHHGMFDDGKPKSRAAGLLRTAFLQAIEALEDLLLLVLRNTRAGIAHAHGIRYFKTSDGTSGGSIFTETDL